MDVANMVELVKMVEELQNGGKITDFVYSGRDAIIVDVDGVSHRFEIVL